MSAATAVFLAALVGEWVRVLRDQDTPITGRLTAVEDDPQLTVVIHDQDHDTRIPWASVERLVACTDRHRGGPRA